MSWISIRDSLPQEARLEVFVTNGRVVAPAWWVVGRFEAFCSPGMALKWVTHWRRFPVPPQRDRADLISDAPKNAGSEPGGGLPE